MKKIYTVIIGGLYLLPNTAWAQSVMDELSKKSGNTNCQSNGTCEVNDFLYLLVIASEFIIKYSGVLALVAFIYGGVLFLTSAGSSDRVTKGKKIIIGSLIGLAIVFLSYTIVGFIAKSLGINTSSNGNIFNTGWF